MLLFIFFCHYSYLSDSFLFLPQLSEKLKKKQERYTFLFQSFGGLEREGWLVGMTHRWLVFLCPVFAVCRQRRKHCLMTAGNYWCLSVAEKQGPCPGKLSKDPRGRDGRAGFQPCLVYTILATPRNKIEELQQRKEADLKAQLARTQKLQQELEAANQVMGLIP